MTDADDVRRGLDDLGPFGLLDRLGIRYRREGRAARFCCPWHAERTPSATLRIGPEGTLRAHCFGACNRSWNGLQLVSVVRGLDAPSDFRRAFEEAAEIAGVRLDDSRPVGENQPRAQWARSPAPPPTYPDNALAFWSSLPPVTSDADVVAYLAGRGLDPDRIARLDLARALSQDSFKTSPPTGREGFPRWARFAGLGWDETKHKLVCPAYDARGRLRSVRATRITDGETPKRLAPAGHSCAGLAFANPAAWALLVNSDVAEDIRRTYGAIRIVVAEGEPDFLTFATHTGWCDWAVLGVFSGSWSADVAARIPDGARVVIATHEDAAGEKYSNDIVETLRGRVDLDRFCFEVAS